MAFPKGVNPFAKKGAKAEEAAPAKGGKGKMPIFKKGVAPVFKKGGMVGKKGC